MVSMVGFFNGGVCIVVSDETLFPAQLLFYYNFSPLSLARTLIRCTTRDWNPPLPRKRGRSLRQFLSPATSCAHSRIASFFIRATGLSYSNLLHISLGLPPRLRHLLVSSRMCKHFHGAHNRARWAQHGNMRFISHNS